MKKILKRFSKAKPKKLLYRDYIKKSLYHPSEGYFTKQENIQLGSLTRKLTFHKMIGYSDYSYMLNKYYPENHFLTPSEIFSPFYGMSMAKKIEKDFLQKNEKDQKKKMINILEIGSGLGTQADSFLKYFKNLNSKLYWKINYTLVEISPILLERSKKVLKQSHKELIEKGQIKFVNKDAFKLNDKFEDEIYLLLFEVLDNLPHDLICFEKKNLEEFKIGKLISDDNFLTKKTVFEKDDDLLVRKLFDNWKELYVRDGKIMKSFLSEDSFFKKFGFYKKYYQFLNNLFCNKFEIYLPTGFYELMNVLNKNFPKGKYIMSDFSSLPDTILHKNKKIIFNNPLISRKMAKSEEKKDFGNIDLSPFGKVDIFFPTDFFLAKNILQNVIGIDCKISTPKKFFFFNAEEKWAETKSGYNPMKEDFQNTKFLHFD